MLISAITSDYSDSIKMQHHFIIITIITIIIIYAIIIMYIYMYVYIPLLLMLFGVMFCWSLVP
jgi:hypothetical protein